MAFIPLTKDPWVFCQILYENKSEEYPSPVRSDPGLCDQPAYINIIPQTLCGVVICEPPIS